MERHDWQSAGAILAAPLSVDLTALAVVGLAASARIQACHEAAVWRLVDHLGLFGWLGGGDVPNPGAEDAMREARIAWNGHVTRRCPLPDLCLWEAPRETASALDLMAWPASRGAVVFHEAARRIAGQAEGGQRLIRGKRIQRLDELAEAATDAARSLARQARIGWDNLSDADKRQTGDDVSGLYDLICEAGVMVLALPSPALVAVRA